MCEMKRSSGTRQPSRTLRWLRGGGYRAWKRTVDVGIAPIRVARIGVPYASHEDESVGPMKSHSPSCSSVSKTTPLRDTRVRHPQST